MSDEGAKPSAPGVYLAVRIFSWVTLALIVVAIVFALFQSYVNWDAIRV